MKRILATALVLFHVGAVAAQPAPDTVLMQNNLNPVRSGQMLVTPTGGTQEKLSDALPAGGACNVFVTRGTIGPGTEYVGSGAITPTDFVSIIDGSSPLAMTLGAGTVNGHPITLIGGGTYTSTVQISINGTVQTVSIAPNTLANLVWNAALGTYTQC